MFQKHNFSEHSQYEDASLTRGRERKIDPTDFMTRIHQIGTHHQYEKSAEWHMFMTLELPLATGFHTIFPCINILLFTSLQG